MSAACVSDTAPHIITSTTPCVRVCGAQVPSRADIIIWEYAVNDDDPMWQVTADVLARRQMAIELFAARALAINPRATLWFLFLWQNWAVRCWPHCDDTPRNNRPAWRATTAALASASGMRGAAVRAAGLRACKPHVTGHRVQAT